MTEKTAASTKAKPATAATPRAKPVAITGSIEGFVPPSKPVHANAAKYPFDSIGVGEFFSVQGKNKRQMTSSVANANKKYRAEAKDASGAVVNVVQEREFYAVDVDAATADRLKGTAHEGATVLVVRSK